MKIYKTEIKDGIAELVVANSSIAICSEVSPYSPTDIDIQTTKAIAENIDQQDLYYLKAVLASVGWNKNDDVFDAAETWNARSTPEDKQFNYMHDEKDIIGHITSSYIADHLGNRIDDINSSNQLPQYFDVVMGSVLYKSWSDKDLRARMYNIINEIESGDTWHVSMECLFPAFDYAMTASNGETKVVKREETSAFLTKHLRAYGGSGEYNGYKVGRLLRNFSFSGVGLVKKPANPRSVILNNTKAIFFEENIMQEDLEVLKAELAEAKTAKEKMEEEAKKAKSELETALSDLKAQLSASEEALAAEKSEKEKMAEEMKKMKEKAAMNEEEMKKMKKEKMMMKRKAQLVEAGFAEAELETTLASFESLEDSMFDVVVAAIKSKQTPTEKKEGEKPAGPLGDKVKSEEEVDANEADAEILDSAEASEDIPMVDPAEEEDMKSFASDWFSKNVLKTTANIK